MDTAVRTRLAAVMIGGLAIALVAVGMVVAVRDPPAAEPGTPEATAQGYYQALVDRDPIAAESFLVSDVLERCSELHRQFGDAGSGLRVVIVGTNVQGTRATVTVSITETDASSPLLLDSHTFEEVLSMEKVGDRWLIAEPPWPLYCGEV